MAGSTRTYLFNTASPGPSVKLLTTDIKPIFDASDFEITCAFSDVGKLYVTRSLGGVENTSVLNSGYDLVATATYTFTLAVTTSIDYNFVYSSAAGTTLFFKVNEISG